MAQGVIFHKPSVPVISPLLSRVIEDKYTIDGHYMGQATRKAVNFLGGIRAAQKSKIIDEKIIWVELGPRPLCTNFVRNSMEEAGRALPSLRRDENSWATLSDALCQLHSAGVEIDWKEYNRPYEKALKLLDLPTYAWTNKNFWIQYTGDWSLVKGNQQIAQPEETMDLPPKLPPGLQTSSIHGIVEESYSDHSAKLVVETDIRDPSMLEAVDGRAMNGYGVLPGVSYKHALLNEILIQLVDGPWRDCIYDGRLSLQKFGG